MSVPAGYFGLTGGIASGKSTVAAIFSELGAHVINADKIGHELLLPDSPAFPELIVAFGREILDSANQIDRRKLGSIVFADPAKLHQLNRIIHPRIIAQVEQLATAYCSQNPGAVVIVDAALIYETGIGDRFAKVIVAWCPPEQQVERLMAKAGLTHEEADRRVNCQMPSEEKSSRADFVIDCSRSMQDTRRQVEALYPKLQQLAFNR